MKRSFIKSALLLLLCATLAFCAVGCDKIVGPNAGKNNPNNPNVPGAASSESSVDSLHSVAEGEGMSQYDIINFFDTYALPLCIAINYFGGSGTPYNSKQVIEDAGAHWAPTTTIYETLADLENYASVFFGGSFLSDLRTVAGLEGDEYPPRYKDINGKLYIRTDAPNEELNFSLDSKTIEVVSNTENEVKLTINGTLNGDSCEVRIIMTRTKDVGWHITYFVPNMTEADGALAAAPGAGSPDASKDSGKESSKATGSNESRSSK